MKRSKVCLFAFRPEHYRQMEDYLNQMASEGWKLRWCRGVLAGFVPLEGPLRYVVDPHAVTTLACLRRYPKSRLQERMREGWYAAGRSKGCQILATEDPDLGSPLPERNLEPLVRSTCRLASLIWVLALAAALAWLLRSSAVVYSVILTNLYLVLGALAVFLLAYHGVNALLLTLPPREPRRPRLCGRYLVHSALLPVCLLAAIALELGDRGDMLFYLLIPIGVLLAAGLVLRSMAGARRDTSRLLPVVGLVSVVLFGMILFLNGRMSDANAAWSAQQRETLLARAGELPVLRLSDFGDTGERQQAVRTNRSLLADNLLYAEESEAGYVFTNCTVARGEFLAEQIFRYLYQQAQRDNGEAFTPQAAGGRTLYVLREANACLLREGNLVYYFTIPQGEDLTACAGLLLGRSAEALPRS